MLISTSKRETTLSDRPGARSSGAHLGPGKYSVDKHSIAARRKGASYGGFGTSERNLVPIKEGPGPARFQKNQFDFSTKSKKRDELQPSSVFKDRKDRFANAAPESGRHLGPGHYTPMRSDFDKKRPAKPAAPAPAVRVAHKPSVPSVPRLNQSFGYEEDDWGTLRLHRPQRTVYGGDKFGNHNDVNDRTSWISKQIRDTVGPAYYDRPDDTAFAAARARRSKPGKTAGGHVPFGKTKDQRRLFEPTNMGGNAMPDRSNPGPGHYDFHIKVSNRLEREKKKASAAFASDVPQLHDAVQNYRASLPGPSNYRPVDATHRNKVLHTGVSSFGSHTDRTSVFDPKPDVADAPGPGSYAGGVAAASTIGAKAATSLAQMTDAESAFGSTAERPCLAPTKTATAVSVGPGAYGDSRTFSGLTKKINHMATVGARGVFSTTAARFQPDVNVDGSRITDTPGVGRYKMKEPRFQRDRESSSFQSTSSRRARPTVGRQPDYVMVGSDATPGAGAYNIEGAMSIGGAAAARLASKGKGTATNGGLPFNATAPRLVQNEMFGKPLRPTPGPGQYTHNNGTLAHRVKSRSTGRTMSASGGAGRGGGGAGGGFGGSTVRFQKDGPTVGSYGAGYDPNSMVRKSFNRKAGYQPSKPLDRRVVRSHTDHQQATVVAGRGVTR